MSEAGYPLVKTRSSSVIRAGPIDLKPTSLTHRNYSMPDVHSYVQHQERVQSQWPFRYLYNDYWYDRYYYTGNVYYRSMFPRRYYYYFGSHVPVDGWNYPYHYWARAGDYSKYQYDYPYYHGRLTNPSYVSMIRRNYHPHRNYSLDRYYVPSYYNSRAKRPFYYSYWQQ